MNDRVPLWEEDITFVEGHFVLSVLRHEKASFQRCCQLKFAEGMGIRQMLRLVQIRHADFFEAKARSHAKKYASTDGLCLLRAKAGDRMTFLLCKCMWGVAVLDPLARI